MAYQKKDVIVKMYHGTEFVGSYVVEANTIDTGDGVIVGNIDGNQKILTVQDDGDLSCEIQVTPIKALTGDDLFDHLGLPQKSNLG